CVGSGLCEQTCPEVFDVDIVAHVKVDPVPEHLEEAVRQAAANCPTEAIELS
ncbi:MAG TPA: ferredoxin, partial [Acidimicrobiia bacterium]|nr:ferredoxin [Acidimicrobiia bacterium]